MRAVTRYLLPFALLTLLIPTGAQGLVVEQRAPFKPKLVASAAVIAEGDVVRFTGRVDPAKVKTSRPVVLQQRRGTKWVNVQRSKSTRKGRFTIGRYLDDAGSYEFRVLGKPVGRKLKRVVTNVVRVQVTPRRGSAEAPYAPGEAFEIGEFSYQFTATDFAAWPRMQAVEPLATPPPSGWTYVAVGFTVTRIGDGRGTPALESAIEFVDAHGEALGPFAHVNGAEVSCFVESDWVEVPELATGQTAQATACFPVPRPDAVGGHWKVRADLDEAYISAE